MYKLSLSEASQLIRNGKISPSTLLERLLDRIDALEPRVEAWVTVDREGARAAADKLTEEAEERHIRGPLHGIPVGVKDIFYTEGIRTTMGSPIYDGFVPSYDAAAVRLLKEKGAIILGKTETTEFASLDPAPTRNPWNLRHTPGGSSSGSAAAVSSGMCYAALGSQTGGSVIRPASFCGVIGFKPTYDLISRSGVYPLSWSLDHVGFFTRTVDDAANMLDALTGKSADFSGENVPRIGLLKDYFHDNAEEEVWEGLEEAVEKIRDAGAEFVESPLPAVFPFVHSAHRIIMATEAASVHEENFSRRRHDYRPLIRGLVASGFLVPASAFVKAKRIRARFIQEALKMIKRLDCFATSSAPTPALRGLESTGDSAFNSPWSLCGFPVVTVPSGITKSGLPLGIQLVAAPMHEADLLKAAKYCEEALGFQKAPREPA